jgi:hypothetical protein
MRGEGDEGNRELLAEGKGYQRMEDYDIYTQSAKRDQGLASGYTHKAMTFQTSRFRFQNSRVPLSRPFIGYLFRDRDPIVQLIVCRTPCPFWWWGVAQSLTCAHRGKYLSNILHSPGSCEEGGGRRRWSPKKLDGVGDHKADNRSKSRSAREPTQW